MKKQEEMKSKQTVDQEPKISSPKILTRKRLRIESEFKREQERFSDEYGEQYINMQDRDSLKLNYPQYSQKQGEKKSGMKSLVRKLRQKPKEINSVCNSDQDGGGKTTN